MTYIQEQQEETNTIINDAFAPLVQDIEIVCDLHDGKGKQIFDFKELILLVSERNTATTITNTTKKIREGIEDIKNELEAPFKGIKLGDNDKAYLSALTDFTKELHALLEE